MALLEQDHAFEIADALIDASEADETEVTLECVEDRFIRFSADGPTQTADRESYELAVRVRFAATGGGFREARARCGGIDEETAFGALGRALTLARIATDLPDAVPLGGPTEVPETSPSRPTQDHSFREKAQWIRAAQERADADDLAPAGLARTTVASRSLANSAGRRVFGATSRAEFSLTCADRTRAAGRAQSSAARTSVHTYADEIDADLVAQDVAASAVRGREPSPIDAAPMDVVLAPPAVSALLTWLAAAGSGAQELAEGSSFMSGRLGEELLDRRLSVVDDPAHPRFAGWRFDGEGYPTLRTSLVASGQLVGPVTDARWAARLGLANTGHAMPQPSAAGPRSSALVLEPGETDEEQLVEAIEDGLYVRGLHYVNLVDPQDLVLTGLTRGGVFRIRGGEIAEPVENLRFTHSLVDAFRSVIGVGVKLERQPSLMGGEVVAPALALRDFRFTSAAPGASS